MSASRGSGQRIFVLMHVFASASGSEMTLTLFRQPGMLEEVFTHDIAWVGRDLATPKRLSQAG